MEKKKIVRIPNYEQCVSKGTRLALLEHTKQGEVFFGWFKKFIDRPELMYYDGVNGKFIKFKPVIVCGPRASGLSMQFQTKLASYNLIVRDGKITLCYMTDKVSGRENYIIEDCPSKPKFERLFRKYVKSPEYKEMNKRYNDALEEKKNKKRKK